jgi:hypothetical protein
VVDKPVHTVVVVVADSPEVDIALEDNLAAAAVGHMGVAAGTRLAVEDIPEEGDTVVLHREAGRMSEEDIDLGEEEPRSRAVGVLKEIHIQHSKFPSIN